MKTTLLLIAAALLTVPAVQAHDPNPTVKSPVISAFEERNVKNFNGIVAGGPIQVIVKLGTTESLRFEGDKDAIATLISEVRGALLVIRPQTSWVSWARKYENKKIIAYVTAKQISSLAMSGDGSITVSGTITAAEFAATLSGSGFIKAQVDADELTGVVSGSGTADIGGKADEASITVSGAGSFGNNTLSVNELSARISGKGNINVNTNGTIKALISGSGHIYYSGNPDIQKTVLGSGNVVER